MKSKGFFSHSLQILIGIVAAIFIFMITSHFLGIWASLQYEQEAEKSAKNLQTAINYACASPLGTTTTVDINLPQKVTTKGAESNPLKLMQDLISGDIESIRDALKYMAAIDSYGDPWYIIYYEKFPAGEDSGWTGWSEVAAMRSTSAVSRAINVATCAVEIIPFSKAGGKILDIVKTLKVGRGTKIATEVAEEASRTKRAIRRTVETAKKIREASGSARKYISESIFSKVYLKMAPKVKASADKILNWFIIKSPDELAKHFPEVAKGMKVAGSMSTLTDNTLKPLKNKYIKIVEGDLTNLEVKEIIQNQKALADASSLAERKNALNSLGVNANNYYTKKSDEMKEFLNKIRDYEDSMIPYGNSPLTIGEKDFIRSVVEKVRGGDVPEIREVQKVREIIENKIRDDDILRFGLDDYMNKMEEYTKLHRIGKNLNPDNIIGDSAPWSWSREFYRANKKQVIQGLPGIIAYTAKKRGGHITTRWGTWAGASFVFSNLLDLAQIAQLKFSPCGPNSLCLKSQANPSITRYPLEECEQAGINYIQLEKHATISDKSRSFIEIKNATVKIMESSLPKTYIGMVYPIGKKKGRESLSCVENTENHKIYCFGGLEGNIASGYYFDQIFEYDPDYDMVSERSSKINPARARHSCVESSLNHKIYCFGGINNTGDYMREVLSYSQKKGKTDHVSEIDGREGLSCVESSVNQKIYCFGGYNGDYLDLISIFDPSDNTTSNSGANLPNRVAYLSCVESSLNYKIYCFGGYNGAYLNEIVKFDPEADSTSTIANFGSGKAYISCTESSANHKIYCFGGYGSGGNINGIFEFDPTDNTINDNTEKVGELPFKVSAMSCAEESKNGKIYCFGGSTDTEQSDKIIEYIPPKEKFLKVENMKRSVQTLFGSTSYSKFYTASPCAGKLIINHTTCKCSVKKEPYYDHESTNLFNFSCTIQSQSNMMAGVAVCNMSKYIPYIDNISTQIVYPNINAIAVGGVGYKVEANFTDIVRNDAAYEELRNCNLREYNRFFNSLDLTCTKYVTAEFPEHFQCSFSLTAVPFCTTECEGSNLWLECDSWEDIDNYEKEQEGLTGSIIVNLTKWCCTKWDLVYYGYGSTDRVNIINVGRCKNYNWGPLGVAGGSSRDEIRGNLDSLINDLNNGIYSWGISNPENYIDSIKEDIEKVIKETSEIELRTDPRLDPNDENIGSLYDYNLDPEDEIPCLKINYVSSPETKGFCYSAPPDSEQIKEIGWMIGSIAVEIAVEGGVTALCGLLSGGTAIAVCSSAASIGACELGNYIMWFGQNQITKSKQERLWPRNPYFDEYFIE